METTDNRMDQSTWKIIDNLRNMSKQMDAVLRRDLFEAATRLEVQAETIERMRLEMVNPDDLSQQMLKLIAGMNEAKAAQVRPEPSRLEIAAMILASSCSHPDRDCGGGTIWALEYADALIAAAKEVK